MTASPSANSLLLVLVVMVIAADASCGRGAAPASSEGGDGGVRDTDGAAPSTPEAPVVEGPRFDEDGVPLPAKNRQAMGAPIPDGFTREREAPAVVTYLGEVEVSKTVAFYRKYLDCVHVEQARKGWVFRGATPRAPGDTTRSIDVHVRGPFPGYSTVVIFDRTGGAPPTNRDPDYFDDVQRRGHKGIGSVDRPIPGTY